MANHFGSRFFAARHWLARFWRAGEVTTVASGAFHVAAWHALVPGSERSAALVPGSHERHALVPGSEAQSAWGEA